MLNVHKEGQGDKLLVRLEGRLDSNTAPSLKDDLISSIEDVHELTLDFDELDYVSSAGLSVILSTQKRMLRQGSMTVKNVNEQIMEVFELTGFADILTIE